MTIESIVVQMAFYYRESLYTDKEKKTPNVVVTEAIRWFKDRFRTEDAAAAFAVKVKANFHPTSTVPFPLISNLVDIDNIHEPIQPALWDDQKRLYDENARYGEPAEITMGDAMSAFAERNNVPLEPTEAGTEKPSDDIYAEAEINFTHAIKTYGLMRVYQAYCECHHD